MPTPTISFVIPCYKLAHFLAECVESIRRQTYSDLEILIMDDCSPDSTTEVARSFADARVRYVRNEQNLGALRNYNKGIELSRGKYVWLISADDYLRVPYILERYVRLLEHHPSIGYAFCPGVGVRNGRETELLTYSVHGEADRISNGRQFLTKLLKGNSIVAASVLARRSCYETAGNFPLKPGMAWSGDWYLWCVFALHFDVAYFAEPMVCYREHALSMTSAFTTGETIHNCTLGDIAVPWMVSRRATELGLSSTAKYCLRSLAQEYARHRTSKSYHSLKHPATSFMTEAEFQQSLSENTGDKKVRNWLRARTAVEVGDILCARGDCASARRAYVSGLRHDLFMPSAYLKAVLSSSGKPGAYLRTVLSACRQMVAQH